MLKVKSINNFLIVCSMVMYAINVNIASLLILMLMALYVFEFVKSPFICKKIDDGLWTFFIILFPSVLNVLRTHEFHTYLIVGYFLIGLIYMKHDSSDFYGLLDMLKIIAIIESVSIYVQFFLPKIYFIISEKLLSASFEEIKSRYNLGYYTGFTKEVSFTVWFIVIGVIYYFVDFYYEKRKKSLIIFLVLLGSLFLSGKKAQPLFVAISLLLVYIIISNKRLRFFKLIFWLTAFVGIISLSYPVWSKLDFMQRYVELIQSIVKGSDIYEITTGRIEIYRNAIELWNKNKIFGIGWGNFRFDVPKTAWYSWFDVHNCYLQLLCETGVVGMFIYTVLMSLTFFKTIRCLINIENLEIEDRKRISISSTILLFFWGYSITGTCLYEYSYYIIYFLCIKNCNYIYRKIKGKRRYGKKNIMFKLV